MFKQQASEGAFDSLGATHDPGAHPIHIAKLLDFFPKGEKTEGLKKKNVLNGLEWELNQSHTGVRRVFHTLETHATKNVHENMVKYWR